MSKSQWGSLGQALAKKETKIEKLVTIIIQQRDDDDDDNDDNGSRQTVTMMMTIDQVLTSCPGDPVAGIGQPAAFSVKVKKAPHHHCNVSLVWTPCLI